MDRFLSMPKRENVQNQGAEISVIEIDPAPTRPTRCTSLSESTTVITLDTSEDDDDEDDASPLQRKGKNARNSFLMFP